MGQRIDNSILELLELILVAGYTPKDKKLIVLQKASIKADLLKILISLSFETKCINNNKYQQLASQILEIGKMLGGWIKTTNNL